MAEATIGGDRRRDRLDGQGASATWAVTMLLAPEAEVITGSTLSLDCGRRRSLP
jgi:hypothetical protein